MREECTIDRGKWGKRIGGLLYHNTLLTKFQTTPVLHLPNVHQPFIVMTDASLLASGGVLMQQDGNSDLHPCAYLSQTFTPAE